MRILSFVKVLGVGFNVGQCVWAAVSSGAGSFGTIGATLLGMVLLGLVRRWCYARKVLNRYVHWGLACADLVI